jgi:hypothetical protein
MARLHARRQQAHRCTRCNARIYLAAERWYCRACRERRKAERKAWRADRISRGLCRECAVPVLDGRSCCPYCEEVKRRRRA